MWGPVAPVPTLLPKVQEQRAPKLPRTFKEAKHAKKTKNVKKRKEKPSTLRGQGSAVAQATEEEGLSRAKARLP